MRFVYIIELAPFAIYCRTPTYFGIGVLLHFSDKSNKENSPIAFRAFTALGNKSQNDKVVFYKESKKAFERFETECA